MADKRKLEDILEELKEWVEDELKETTNTEKSKRWKPKKDEIYYFVDDYMENEVRDAVWENDGIDNKLYNIHNCFETRGEAEEHAYNLETKRLLMVFADEHNEDIDWKDYNQFKYGIYYNYEYDKLNAMSTDSIRKKDIYFSSEEIVEQAIKEIGEERIKKYLLEE